MAPRLLPAAGRRCALTRAAWLRTALTRSSPATGALPADLLPEADLPEVGSEAVAELSVAMRPRYHFVGTEGQWYQRPPHRQGARCAHVCRLLAMAKVQEDKKQTCVLAR